MAEVDAGLQALAEQALLTWDLRDVGIETIGISENASFRVDTPYKRYVLRRLRPQARWHDGTPITTRDVKFTFEVVLLLDIWLESEPIWTSRRRSGG